MYLDNSYTNFPGALVDANLDIFKACLERKFIEFLIPQDFAKLISVRIFAGPGNPAWISILFPSSSRCFSHVIKLEASKKNCVTKYNFA